jgi:phosphohistidine swiveling domain-containing protein
MLRKKCNQQWKSILCVLGSCLVFFLIGMEKQYKKIVATGDFSIGHIAVGPAFIITDYKGFDKIRKGDIVVTHATDGLCDAALQLSAGIITERGGKNSHAALLGKKFNIPVIVGVTEATQKINDGSVIVLDCHKKTVYEIEKNDECRQEVLHHIAKNFHYMSEFQNVYSDSAMSYDWLLSISHELEEAAFNVAPVSLHAYVSDIKIYVQEIHGDIKKAKLAGKNLAYWVSGISHYAFDCIPFEFFIDEKEFNDTYQRFEENFVKATEYIDELKEICKKQGVLHKGKIDENKLAEILHKQVADKIDVTDEHRELLKEQPLKMGEFVREGIIKKAQYMDLILLNLGVRRKLEEELQAFQKK